MESEIARRRAYEQALAKKMDQIRQFLKQQYEEEQRKRIDFNEANYRYLPENLKLMLEETPTRYSIYPNSNDLSSSQNNLVKSN
jgi:hypothetical protein